MMPSTLFNLQPSQHEEIRCLIFIVNLSTVGISLPKTGVPTVCSERAVSGILYAESTLSTGYTQYVYCNTRVTSTKQEA